MTTLVADQMQNGPEDLVIETTQAVDFEKRRGDIRPRSAGLWHRYVDDLAPLALHPHFVALEHVLSRFVYDGSNVYCVIERIANIERLDGACQHGFDARRVVVLNEQDARRRAALPGTVESGPYGIADHLLRESRGICNHCVDATSLGNEGNDGASPVRQRPLDRPRRIIG